MPGLAYKSYVELHHSLRRLWLNRQGTYAQINVAQQWDLHTYFQPAHDWSDKQLLDHRRRISKEQPSLPQRAGRALGAFIRANMHTHSAEAAPVMNRGVAHAADSRRVVVTGLVLRPDPDIRKIAKALLIYAASLEKQKREQSDGLGTG